MLDALPEARGALGLWYPWLIKSELLHYLYAVIMLIGIWTLRNGPPQFFPFTNAQ